MKNCNNYFNCFLKLINPVTKKSLFFSFKHGGNKYNYWRDALLMHKYFNDKKKYIFKIL